MLSSAIDAPEEKKSRIVWPTIAASFALGFLISALIFPSWTDNVEGAQVVSGLLKYPPGNPMEIYHRNILTILNDSAAVLMRMGFSEWTLSVLYSGLQGGLTFASLTALTLAFVESPVLALLVPVLILRLSQNVVDLNTNVFGFWPYPYLQTFHGHQYPILIPSHTSIYGVVSLFFGLLVLGLFALKKWRAAALLTGLFPWVHPSMSLPVIAGAGFALFASRMELDDKKKEILKYFLTGAVISAAALLAHKFFISPTLDNSRMDEANRIVSVYKFACDHIYFPEAAVLSNILEIDFYVIILGAILWIYFRNVLSGGLKFLFKAMALITIVGILFTTWTYYSIDSQPFTIQRLMLSRWLNINSMLFPVFVFGILGYYGISRRNPLALAFLFLNSILIVFLVVDGLTNSMHVELLRSAPTAWTKVSGYLFPLLGGAAAAAMVFIHPVMEKNGWIFSESRYFTRAVNAALGALIVFCLSVYIFPRYSSQRAKGIDIWTPAMEYLSKGKGLMIVPEEFWLRPQVRTRRGVLLDFCQMNFLIYVPEAAPAVENIANKVYNASLMNGFYSIRARGVWDRRSTEEWMALGKEFGATSVAAPPDMKIDLPIEFVSTNLVIYKIPPL